VWTLFHPYAFDFSVWELFGALLSGGRLEIVPHEVSRAPDAFAELLRRTSATVLNQTPSAFRSLVEFVPDLPSLRLVIFGGETLDLESVRRWHELRGGDARLVNMFGITETTVHVTVCPLEPEFDDEWHGAGTPIARPRPDLSA